MRALEDRGLILNGLVSLGLSSSFTRFPQRKADCPGVIDYLCASPAALQRTCHGSLRTLESHTDFSDHVPLALEVRIDSSARVPNQEHIHFHEERLPLLKMPSDTHTWSTIESELSAEFATLGIADSLRTCLEAEVTSAATAATLVSTSMGQIIDTFYRIFKKHKLIQKRSSDGASHTRKCDRGAAPKFLRELRVQASHARRDLCELLRTDAPPEMAATAKRR